jgi:dynein heavy chain
VVARISEKPVNEQELSELQKYIQDTKGLVEGICLEVDKIHEMLDLLSSFGHEQTTSDFNLAWSTKQWPNRVQDVAVSSMVALEDNLIKMHNKLQNERTEFEEKLEMYAQQVEAFKEFGSLDALNKTVEEAMRLDDDLRAAQDQGADFNAREKVFGWPLTEYKQLFMMREEFQPYFDLWFMTSEFNTNERQYLTGPFTDLNAKEIEVDCF